MPELGGCIAGFGLGGGSSFGGQGTRGVPFQKQQEQDSSGATGGAKQTVYYNSISAMPQYNSKSHEELRWEDCQVNVQPVTSPSHVFGVLFLPWRIASSNPSACQPVGMRLPANLCPCLSSFLEIIWHLLRSCLSTIASLPRP